MNILSLSRVLAAAALLALLAAPAVQAKQIMRVAHGGPDSRRRRIHSARAA